jgi:hypothetical protein
VNDQSKRFVGEGRQIGHVSLGRFDGQPVAAGDVLVLFKLPGRVVEHRDDGPRRGEQRPLLPAP